MLRVKIKTNYPKLERQLNDFIKKQIPYATARTLTELAKKAQEQVRKELPEHFTIRNQYVPRGISIQSANKKDWPNLKAVVGSRAEFMKLQEEGGEKRLPSLPGVPVPVRKHVRPVEKQVIKAGMRPVKLLQLTHSKKHYHLQKLRSTGMPAIVFKPTHKKYSTRATPHSIEAERRRQERVEAQKKVRVLWVMPSSAHLKKRWNLFETVQKSVAGEYAKEFGKNLAAAIRSGKQYL